MKRSRTPSVVFQPNVQHGMQKGIELIANVVGPTLGPVPRQVGIEPIGPGDKRPEILDDGGLIARRILALPDRDEDVGAMFLRHVLWRQHERAGDGTATTAVLFHSIYNQGLRYIAPGGNAMRLRPHLERGLSVVLEALGKSALPLAGQEGIAQIAESIGHDAGLAEMLGEIFDIVGEHGQVELRSGRAHEHRREYVTGTYFKGKLASERMITNVRTSRGELVDAAILISDLAIEDPAELAPLLELIRNAGIPSLMVVARELAAGAMAPLLAASRWPYPCRVIVVTFQDTLSRQTAMLDDLAVLTGARPFLSVAHDTLRKVRPEDLGVARRVWADKEYFGIVGGKGSPRAVREHVARLRSAIENSEDVEVRKTLRERLGRLMGGAAVLWVGGISDTDIKARKELAERTVEAVRATIGKGVLPGGGVALLACRPALQRLVEQSDDSDTRAAYQILIRALEEPTRTILRNAGYDAGPWMDRIERAGAGYGLDVRSGEIVEMAVAGIIDSAGVLIAAVHEAVASAALALTVDVLVHKKRPKTSLTT